MNNYDLAAEKFAQKIGLKMRILKMEWESPSWDDIKHAVFTIRFERAGKQWTLKFYQSIAGGAKEPTIYDVLACITKWNPGSFGDFCSEYGYFYNQKRARYIYDGVKKRVEECGEDVW